MKQISISKKQYLSFICLNFARFKGFFCSNQTQLLIAFFLLRIYSSLPQFFVRINLPYLLRCTKNWSQKAICYLIPMANYSKIPIQTVAGDIKCIAALISLIIHTMLIIRSFHAKNNSAWKKPKSFAFQL